MLTSQLAITIWDLSGNNRLVPYGGTTIKLFDENDCTLKRGRQKLKVWLDVPADGKSNSSTDSVITNTKEVDRIERLIKQHATDEIPLVPWLDSLAFRKMEQINTSSTNDTDCNILHIEFAQFNVPVVYSEMVYPPPPMLPSQQHDAFGDGSDTPSNSYTDASSISPRFWRQNQETFSGNDSQNVVNYYSDYNSGGPTGNDTNSLYNDFLPVKTPIICVIDPEQFRENPIERKHRRLNRGSEFGVFDKDLKPSAKIRDDITKIMSYSPVDELTAEEKDKLWKFRYYITRHKQALTKFLKTISWEDPKEVKQAIELLPRWTEIDIDDALELLGPNFKHPAVRTYAVDRLRKASDHELELYLLQLVQALRFERGEKSVRNLSLQGSGSTNTPTFTTRKKSPLAKFLISRAVNNPILGNYFFWYMTVESQEKNAPPIFRHVLNQFQNALKMRDENEGFDCQSNKYGDLQSPTSPNAATLHDANVPKISMLNIMERQITFIDKILKVASEVKALKDPRPKKVEKLRAYLSDPKNGLLRFAPIPLPLDPTVTIVGCVPEDCTVFKSSLSPLKITFKTSSTSILGPQVQHEPDHGSELYSSDSIASSLSTITTSAYDTIGDLSAAQGSGFGGDSESSRRSSGRHHSSVSSHRSNEHGTVDQLTNSISSVSMEDSATNGTYSIMFKTGDDLRQDQLVIQIITLMDQLLRNENLDLQLTPYRILATGPRDGALQFILNKTLASVLSENNNGILGYLREHNPDPTTLLGVTDESMDTYVRSCAGYCVITYILGVGDRHLDNLLICPDGHFFHADFGYILGHDPKPFPPLMKLPIQIIDGMGGINSQNYSKFRALCFTAYTTLRKSANLILNLFALMSHSTIPDIMVERDNAAVLKVKEKFCLDMTEEEAILHFQNLINDSVNAFLPVVIDRFHSLAQYWRA